MRTSWFIFLSGMAALLWIADATRVTVVDEYPVRFELPPATDAECELWTGEFNFVPYYGPSLLQEGIDA